MMNLKHLFKLMWNRRKMNLLMIIEIFISFIIIFVLAQSLVKFAVYYSEPLGFEYKNIWNLEVNSNNMENTEARKEIELIKQEIKSYAEVIEISEAYAIPYTSVDMRTTVELDDKEILTNMMLGDDNYAEVLGIELVAGRWFDEQDNASNYKPIVINRKLKEYFFGDEEAVGKFLGQRDDQRLIIGVVDQIKKRGELNDFGKLLFKRINPENPDSWIGESILIKMKPGTNMDFEEKLMRRLSIISNNFTLEMRSLEAMRERSFDKYSSIVYIFAFISLFLVINVSLGLFGVLWYNINYRKSEIGIRRSFGSTARNIYSQIVGETMVISTFSLILGSFIVFQLYVFLRNWLRPDIFYASYIISVIVIYLITAICAFYPSKLAADIEPAEALHDE